VLPDNDGRSLAIDAQGHKWIGTYEGGLAVYREGGIIVSVTQSRSAGIPSTFSLSQNYPNPFNPETVIEYQLPKASEVEISIFNLQGQKVTTLVRGHQTAGAHKIIWNGTDESGRRVASGIYLYQLKVVDPASGGTGNFVMVKKMLVVR
jgi:hypothetical protein